MKHEEELGKMMWVNFYVIWSYFAAISSLAKLIVPQSPTFSLSHLKTWESRKIRGKIRRIVWPSEQVDRMPIKFYRVTSWSWARWIGLFGRLWFVRLNFSSQIWVAQRWTRASFHHLTRKKKSGSLTSSKSFWGEGGGGDLESWIPAKCLPPCTACITPKFSWVNISLK